MSTASNARKIRIITICVVVFLLLLIIWQNSTPAKLSLLIFSVELPLMVWLALFLATGILIGIALMWSYRRRP